MAACGSGTNHGVGDAALEGSPSDTVLSYDGIHVGVQPAPGDALTSDSDSASPADALVSFDGFIAGIQIMPDAGTADRADGSANGNAMDGPALPFDGRFVGIAPLPADASTTDAVPYDGRLLGAVVLPPDGAASASVGEATATANHIAIGGPQSAPSLPREWWMTKRA